MFPKDNTKVPIVIEFCYETELNLQSLFNKVLEHIDKNKQEEPYWELELITLSSILTEAREQYLHIKNKSNELRVIIT
jgi:hypothetical protein